MPTLKGREAEARRRAEVPAKLRRILRGAARAGAVVIADEAKQRVPSDQVRDGVIVGRSKERGDIVVAKVTVKEGWPRSLGAWLEYGTSAHFISVDPAHAGGRTAQRINNLDTEAAKEGRDGPGRTLIINGKPVGTTVWHPGATEHPWLRPARDVKAREAFDAAQSFITAGVRRASAVPEGESE
ncbi:HK97 gp10 family phage protein [uncultured Sphingomonas sp.]|uniref:HK97 gp10 family phage protein n=1 Tax=uncultured Sphingomonas sp. TaxID=158754 RepID=UPI002598FF01|nr:HK97 gp10 family phage protein [uncultured Sphingomonas sp.]